MNRTDLAGLIHNGENSGVEFKRDDVRPEHLAKEMAALLNLEGGYILLGVEDDGTVSGLVRGPQEAEGWVMETARTHLRPAAIPFWETLRWDDEKVVGIVSLPADAPDKPYKMKRGSAWMTQVRVGTTSRDATDEEEARLYMQSGRLSYDRRSVPGADFEDLDVRRLVNYFRDFRVQGTPEAEDRAPWERLLVNTEIMVEDRDRIVPSVAGLLLFGRQPNRFLPQAGISAVAYSGAIKDYDARERSTLRGPIVSLFAAGERDSHASPAATTVEPGVIEQAIGFVRRNTEASAWVDDGGQRHERPDYPLEAIRETIVNAVAHRDYTISVMDIELSIYVDRLEVISPGRLPNTVTVPKMKAGYRASRNELVKEILRDYRYIEATGLGIPRKIVQGMRDHNGTEPDLEEHEDRFLVRLWKAADPT